MAKYDNEFKREMIFPLKN